ncbi:MAG: glycoside hydrolase family 28 protein [Bacteroidota bacterium]
MKIIMPIAIAFFAFIMSSCETDKNPDEKSLIDKKIDTKINEIVESMPELTFPDTTINLIEYAGFEPDGEGSKNFQPALNKAIKELSEAGGGTIYLSHSSGDSDLWVKETEVYRMDGPINLKSNIRLLLDYGTKIQFTYDPENYLVDGEGVITRWEGVSIKSFSPLIRAFNAENIAIEAADGHGAMPVIDGDGEKWGLWSFENDREREYKKVLHRLSDTDVKLAHREFVDINKDYYRPFLMEFYLCKNVRIEGLELRNTPFWTVHFLFSEYARARNLVFNVHGENSDGVDPESSHNVLIENCHFNNHDDNVAIKSGRNKEGREGVDITGTELEGIESKFIKDDKIYGSTENIVVRNNVLKGHHAICIGSEVAGSVRNVFVNDNTGVQSVRYGLFIKSSPKRGGIVEDIYVRDLKLEKASLGIVLNPCYAKQDTVSSYYPLFKNIYMKDIEIEQARKGAIQILGWPELPIENVHLEGITINEVLNRNQEDWTMVRNANNVTLKNVEIEDQVFDGDFSDSSGEIPVPTE